MLQGEPAEDDDEEEDSKYKALLPHENTHSPPRSETGELLSNAATTLVEGAVPVREFPNNLTSEPASLTHSANSSVVDEKDRDTPRRRRSTSLSMPGSHQEELRCVLAIVRHGDRTPKQKLKVNMTEPHILKYFHDNNKGDCQKDLKVKAKAPLTEFLQTVKNTLKELPGTDHEGVRYQMMHMRDILERWKILGLNRKLQIKPRKFEEYEDEKGELKKRCVEVQLILKWGGNLTKLGEKQSINLGRRLRHEMYPDAPGGGILRLHSTFRHDLKIKTSDEGRVMKTAAAFAKGLLELEGDLPPILVSLVHKEKGSLHMLDPSGNKEVKMELDECKEKITANLQRDIDIGTAKESEIEQLVGPMALTSLRNALENVGNPRKTLFAIHQTMGELLEQLEEMLGDMGSGDEKRIEGGEGIKGENDDDVALSGVKLYKGETLLELTERWRFIYDRLYDSDTDQFDLSRIPDVHDNVRFDVLHNPHLGLTNTLHKLYECAKYMADCVVPQEYGTTVEEKRSVGVKICKGLLEKIMYDLSVARTDNEVDMRYMINMDYSADLPINTMGRRIRTRLYFTSESHLHTVLNALRFAGDGGANPLLSEHGVSIINGTPELCYLTQIVMRVFEDSRREMHDPRRFRVEILFSPGATATPFHLHEGDREQDTSRFDTAPLKMIGREGLTCAEVEEFFEKVIMAGRTEEDENELASTSTATVDAKAPKDKSKKKKTVNLDNGTAREIGKTSAEINSFPPSASVEPDTVTLLKSRTEKGLPESKTDVRPGEAESVHSTNEKPADSIAIPADSHLNVPFKDREAEASKIVARKYFWSTVAVGSFTLAVGCLYMAFSMGDDTRRRRRWASRR
jgi:inositol hexakisphosphate/diphosphoinositol-pentakisphosphate kinase